jgi:heme exporter protein D
MTETHKNVCLSIAVMMMVVVVVVVVVAMMTEKRRALQDQHQAAVRREHRESTYPAQGPRATQVSAELYQ